MAKKIFIDGDPSQGIQGTIVDADFLNNVQNQYHDGLDIDGHGALPYAADSGAANAYAVTLNPALTQYIEGMQIQFKAANTNTGASTININGLGVKALKKDSNVALKINDIQAGQIVTIAYDGTNDCFQMLSAVISKKVVAEKNADFTFTNMDYFISINNLNNSVAGTLPPLAGQAGKEYVVRCMYSVDTYVVQVFPASGETIKGGGGGANNPYDFALEGQLVTFRCPKSEAYWCIDTTVLAPTKIKIEKLVEWPAFIVGKTGNQNVLSTAPTKITWEDDSELNYETKFDTANGRFSPNMVATFTFNISCRVYNINTSEEVFLYVYRNNNGYKSTSKVTTGSTVCFNYSVTVEAVNVTDYFEIFIASTSDVDYYIDQAAAFTHWSGVRSQ